MRDRDTWQQFFRQSFPRMDRAFSANFESTAGRLVALPHAEHAELGGTAAPVRGRPDTTTGDRDNTEAPAPTPWQQRTGGSPAPGGAVEYTAAPTPWQQRTGGSRSETTPGAAQSPIHPAENGAIGSRPGRSPQDPEDGHGNHPDRAFLEKLRDWRLWHRDRTQRTPTSETPDQQSDSILQLLRSNLDFRWRFFGGQVSSFGDAVMESALALWSVGMFGAGPAGAIVAASQVPHIGAALVSGYGADADRLMKFAKTGQLVGGAGAAATAAAILTDAPHLPYFVAAAMFVEAIAYELRSVTAGKINELLVGRERAKSYQRANTMIGPTIAMSGTALGPLMLGWSPAAVFGLNAATFGINWWTFHRLPDMATAPRRVRPGVAEDPDRRFVRVVFERVVQFREGLRRFRDSYAEARRFIKRNPVLNKLDRGNNVMNLYLGFQGLYFASLLNDHDLTSTEQSIASLGIPVGTVLGGVAGKLADWNRLRRSGGADGELRRRTATSATAAETSRTVGLTAATALAATEAAFADPAIAALGLAAFYTSSSLTNTVRGTYVQQVIPPSFKGRHLGLFRATSRATYMLGGAVAGLLIPVDPTMAAWTAAATIGTAAGATAGLQLVRGRAAAPVVEPIRRWVRQVTGIRDRYGVTTTTPGELADAYRVLASTAPDDPIATALTTAGPAAVRAHLRQLSPMQQTAMATLIAQHGRLDDAIPALAADSPTLAATAARTATTGALHRLAHMVARADNLPDADGYLTDTEWAILHGTALGRNLEEIAAQLSIEIDGALEILGKLTAELGAIDALTLVVEATRRGYLDITDLTPATVSGTPDLSGTALGLLRSMSEGLSGPVLATTYGLTTAQLRSQLDGLGEQLGTTSPAAAVAVGLGTGILALPTRPANEPAPPAKSHSTAGRHDSAAAVDNEIHAALVSTLDSNGSATAAECGRSALDFARRYFAGPYFDREHPGRDINTATRDELDSYTFIETPDDDAALIMQYTGFHPKEFAQYAHGAYIEYRNTDNSTPDGAGPRAPTLDELASNLVSEDSPTALAILSITYPHLDHETGDRESTIDGHLVTLARDDNGRLWLHELRRNPDHTLARDPAGDAIEVDYHGERAHQRLAQLRQEGTRFHAISYRIDDDNNEYLVQPEHPVDPGTWTSETWQQTPHPTTRLGRERPDALVPHIEADETIGSAPSLDLTGTPGDPQTATRLRRTARGAMPPSTAALDTDPRRAARDSGIARVPGGITPWTFTRFNPDDQSAELPRSDVGRNTGTGADEVATRGEAPGRGDPPPDVTESRDDHLPVTRFRQALMAAVPAGRDDWAAALHQATREQFEAGLAGLTSSQRRLLEMQFRDGETVEDVARQLHRTTAQVRKATATGVRGLVRTLPAGATSGSRGPGDYIVDPGDSIPGLPAVGGTRYLGGTTGTDLPDPVARALADLAARNQSKSLSANNNDNIVISDGHGGHYMVRFRKPDGDNLDTKLFDEPRLLSELATRGIEHVSRVFAVIPDFGMPDGSVVEVQIHDFILDATTLAGSPQNEIEVAQTLQQLHARTTGRRRKPRSMFLEQFIAEERRKFADEAPRSSPVFRRLGIPADLFSPILEQIYKNWSIRHPIQYCILHGDANDGNLLIRDDGSIILRDLEMARFGDPIWDFAWRTFLISDPDVRSAARARFETVLSRDRSYRPAVFDTYLLFMTIDRVFHDTVRLSRRAANGTLEPSDLQFIRADFLDALRTTHEALGVRASNPISAEEIFRALGIWGSAPQAGDGASDAKYQQRASFVARPHFPHHPSRYAVRAPDLPATTARELNIWADNLDIDRARRAMIDLRAQAVAQLEAIRRGEQPDTRLVTGPARALNALLGSLGNRLPDFRYLADPDYVHLLDDSLLTETATDVTSWAPLAQDMRAVAKVVVDAVGTIVSGRPRANQLYPLLRDYAATARALEQLSASLRHAETAGSPVSLDPVRSRLIAVAQLLVLDDRLSTGYTAGWHAIADELLHIRSGQQLDPQLVAVRRRLPARAEAFARARTVRDSEDLVPAGVALAADLLSIAAHELTQTTDFESGLAHLREVGEILESIGRQTGDSAQLQRTVTAIRDLSARLSGALRLEEHAHVTDKRFYEIAESELLGDNLIRRTLQDLAPGAVGEDPLADGFFTVASRVRAIVGDHGIANQIVIRARERFGAATDFDTLAGAAQELAVDHLRFARHRQAVLYAVLGSGDRDVGDPLVRAVYAATREQWESCCATLETEEIEQFRRIYWDGLPGDNAIARRAAERLAGKLADEMDTTAANPAPAAGSGTRTPGLLPPHEYRYLGGTTGVEMPDTVAIDLIAEALTNAASALTGNYHLNIPVGDPATGRFMVRIDIEDSDGLDIKTHVEHDVLRNIAEHTDIETHRVFALRTIVLPDGRRAQAQILGYIEGASARDALDVSPEQLAEAVARMHRQLESIPAEEVDPGDFLRKKVDELRSVYDAHRAEFGEYFTAFGISDATFDSLMWLATLADPGRSQWIHGDLHTGNILVKDDKSIIPIDFELATVGPREYDNTRFQLLLGNDAVADKEFTSLFYVQRLIYDTIRLARAAATGTLTPEQIAFMRQEFRVAYTAVRFRQFQSIRGPDPFHRLTRVFGMDTPPAAVITTPAVAPAGFAGRGPRVTPYYSAEAAAPDLIADMVAAADPEITAEPGAPTAELCGASLEALQKRIRQCSDSGARAWLTAVCAELDAHLTEIRAGRQPSADVMQTAARVLNVLLEDLRARVGAGITAEPAGDYATVFDIARTTVARVPTLRVMAAAANTLLDFLGAVCDDETVLAPAALTAEFQNALVARAERALRWVPWGREDDLDPGAAPIPAHAAPARQLLGILTSSPPRITGSERDRQLLRYAARGADPTVVDLFDTMEPLAAAFADARISDTGDAEFAAAAAPYLSAVFDAAAYHLTRSHDFDTGVELLRVAGEITSTVADRLPDITSAARAATEVLRLHYNLAENKPGQPGYLRLPLRRQILDILPSHSLPRLAGDTVADLIRLHTPGAAQTRARHRVVPPMWRRFPIRTGIEVSLEEPAFDVGPTDRLAAPQTATATANANSFEDDEDGYIVNPEPVAEAFRRLPYRAHIFDRAIRIDSFPDLARAAAGYLTDLRTTVTHAFTVGDINAGTLHLKSAVSVLTSVGRSADHLVRIELQQLCSALDTARDVDTARRIAKKLTAPTHLHRDFDRTITALRTIGAVTSVVRTLWALGNEEGFIPRRYLTDSTALGNAIGTEIRRVPLAPLATIKQTLRNDGDTAVIVVHNAATETEHAWLFRNIDGELFAIDDLIADEPGLPRIRRMGEWRTPYSDDSRPGLTYSATYFASVRNEFRPVPEKAAQSGKT
ncbi:phosphotransferase [Nocardia sp. NPDC050799]|uniref:phosphotransferase n=1 Tax=Nocardia sp. NPDC050799 TaxID=3154842 RepID=UPI0033C8330E